MSNPAAVSESPPLPERFEVKGELGRGGMGVVFRAFDRIGEREVAIKFLPHTDDQNLIRRFRREAGDLAAIFHPNVVDFYSLGECQGRDFIEMELVDGGDLRSFVRDSKSLGAVLEVYAKTLDGLAYIHQLGMVHRDIKPANVLVSSEGVAKISDLGLVRRVEERTQLTQDGTILGTSSYLAPEQLLSHAVGPEADLYAIGVCLFEAVTGDRLFQAASPLAMIRAHVDQKPRTPSEVRPGLPSELDELILSLLEKKPDRRLTAEQTAAQLRTIVKDLTPEQDMLCATSPDALLARAKLHLDSGHFEESLDLLEEAESGAEDAPLKLEIELVRARIYLVRRPSRSVEISESVVAGCRESHMPKLGEALVVNGRANTILQKWDTALSVLQEARGLISSSQVDLQAELMQALADLHEKGAEAGRSELSLEEAKGFRQIAEGLHKRRDSQSVSVPNDAPKSKPKAQAKSKAKAISGESVSLKRLRIPLALIALVLLIGGVVYAMRPTTASLMVDSDPPGAVVLIDKKRFVAPYSSQKMEPGAYRVKVHKQGYKPHIQVANLEAGGSLTIKATLKPASGGLSFKSEPEGAKVFINGQPKGKAPLELKGLPLKEFKVKIAKAGYFPKEAKVKVQAGTTQDLTYKLKKIPPPPPPPRRYSSGNGRRNSGGRRSGGRRPKADIDFSLPHTPIRVRMNTPW